MSEKKMPPMRWGKPNSAVHMAIYKYWNEMSDSGLAKYHSFAQRTHDIHEKLLIDGRDGLGGLEAGRTEKATREHIKSMLLGKPEMRMGFNDVHFLNNIFW